MDGTCFDLYLSLCTRFQLGPPWNFLPVDSHAYTGPADPLAAWAMLATRFSEESLIRAGIAQRNAAGLLEIHPFLAAPKVAVVALCDPTHGHVNNLMTDAGCVRGFRFPMFAVLCDGHSYRAINGFWHELILTAYLPDAIVLRGLGFAAAPVVGITELDDYGLKLFGKYFGTTRYRGDHDATIETKLGPPKPEEQAARERIYEPASVWAMPGRNSFGPNAKHFVTVSIARWSLMPLSLVEPESVQMALSFLDDLQRYFAVDLFELQHWTPTPHDLKKIKFALRKREVRWILEALLASFGERCRSLDSLLQKDNAPRDLAAAIHAMQQVYMASPGDSFALERRPSVVAAYLAIMQRDLIGPLMGQLQTIDDPRERAVHAQLVDLYTLFADKMLSLRKQKFAAMRASPRQYDAVDPKDVRELLAMSKQMTSLVSLLLSCNRKHKRTPKSVKLPTNGPTRRFGGLGSATQN